MPKRNKGITEKMIAKALQKRATLFFFHGMFFLPLRSNTISRIRPMMVIIPVKIGEKFA